MTESPAARRRLKDSHRFSAYLGREVRALLDRYARRGKSARR